MEKFGITEITDFWIKKIAKALKPEGIEFTQKTLLNSTFSELDSTEKRLLSVLPNFSSEGKLILEVKTPVEKTLYIFINLKTQRISEIWIR